MHILTKILIVFCAVMSLILAALSMAYASNATAYRQSINEERSRRVAAEAAQAQIVQQNAQEKTSQSERLQGLESALNDARRTEASLQAERTNLLARLQTAEAKSASIENQISQLGATTDTQAALIKNYSEEVKTLREALFKGSQREIELVDRVNELDAQREVLQQNARALKEQLEETKATLQAAQSGGSATPASTSSATSLSSTPVSAIVAREMPGALIQARVLETFRSPAGQDMVVISEGSNRGIRPNVAMNITRGNTFVAGLVIVTVEPNRSVGRVDAVAGLAAVNQGDTVLSRLN